MVVFDVGLIEGSGSGMGWVVLFLAEVTSAESLLAEVTLAVTLFSQLHSKSHWSQGSWSGSCAFCSC